MVLTEKNDNSVFTYIRHMLGVRTLNRMLKDGVENTVPRICVILVCLSIKS